MELQKLRNAAACKILATMIMNEDARRAEERKRFHDRMRGKWWFFEVMPPMAPHNHNILGDAGMLLVEWDLGGLKEAGNALRSSFRGLTSRHRSSTRIYVLGMLGNLNGKENRKLLLSVLEQAIEEWRTQKPRDWGDLTQNVPRELAKAAIAGVIRDTGKDIRSHLTRVLETSERISEDEDILLDLFGALEHYRDPAMVRTMERLAGKSSNYATHVAYLLREFDFPESRALLVSLANNEDAIVRRIALESLKHVARK